MSSPVEARCINVCSITQSSLPVRIKSLPRDPNFWWIVSTPAVSASSSLLASLKSLLRGLHSLRSGELEAACRGLKWATEALVSPEPHLDLDAQ